MADTPVAATENTTTPAEAPKKKWLHGKSALIGALVGGDIGLGLAMIPYTAGMLGLGFVAAPVLTIACVATFAAVGACAGVEIDTLKHAREGGSKFVGVCKEFGGKCKDGIANLIGKEQSLEATISAAPELPKKKFVVHFDNNSMEQPNGRNFQQMLQEQKQLQAASQGRGI